MPRSRARGRSDAVHHHASRNRRGRHLSDARVQFRADSRSRSHGRGERVEVYRRGVSLVPRGLTSQHGRSRYSHHFSPDYDEDSWCDSCYDYSYDALSDEQVDDHQQVERRRFWVNHNECSKIIGRRGETKQLIEKQSGAKLKIQFEDEMDPAVKERYVEIRGTEQAREAALALLLQEVHYCRNCRGSVLKDDRAQLKQDSNQAPPMVIEVLVEEVGRVLGKKGESVKKIQQESGAKLEVDKTTGKVEIFGLVKEQKLCLEMILNKVHVEFVKAGDGRILKDTRGLSSLSLNKQGTKVKALVDSLAADEDEPLKLMVRDRDAGKIIGHGGEVVRLIIEKTGAKIKVKRGEEVKDEEPRVVTIWGTLAQKKKAKELVLEIVSWCSDEEGKILKDSAPDPPPKKGRSKGHATEVKAEVTDTLAKAPEEKDDSRKKTRNPGAWWKCEQCGGDHRSKDCPAAVWKQAVEMGMKMGMKALNGGPLHPMMESMMGGYMNQPMGMNGPRPMMLGMPAVSGLPSSPPQMQMPDVSRRIACGSSVSQASNPFWPPSGLDASTRTSGKDDGVAHGHSRRSGHKRPRPSQATPT